MVEQVQLGGLAVDVVRKDVQERPPQRASADRARQHRRAIAHELGDAADLRHFQAVMDSPAASARADP